MRSPKDREEWIHESHFDADLNSHRKNLARQDAGGSSDSDADHFDRRGGSAKNKPQAKNRARRKRKVVVDDDDDDFVPRQATTTIPSSANKPWKPINPKKSKMALESEASSPEFVPGPVPDQEQQATEDAEPDYFGGCSEEENESPRQTDAPSVPQSSDPPEKEGNDGVKEDINPFSGSYGGDGETDGTSEPLDEDDVVFYDPKEAEACKAFGLAPDSPATCPICFLGFDTKNDESLPETVREIKNRTAKNVGKNHLVRTILFVRNYNSILKDPWNNVTKARIARNPGIEKEILEKQPLIPDITYKQAWFHFNKPHTKDHQNASLLRMETLQFLEEGLKKKMMIKGFGGKVEINVDIIEPLTKIYKQENELRTKQFTNPLFATSSTATAIFTAALGTEMSIDVEVKKRNNDFAGFWLD